MEVSGNFGHQTTSELAISAARIPGACGRRAAMLAFESDSDRANGVRDGGRDRGRLEATPAWTT